MSSGSRRLAMKTMPLASQNARSAGRKPAAGTMNPPSPMMGSMRMAATFVAPISFSIFSSASRAASAPSLPSRKGYEVCTR